MRRGQATLEYVYLIAIVAVAIIAMLAYVSRGFQGNIREKADQIGSGQYEPGKTTVDNIETKDVVSETISKSTTTTVKYGDEAEGIEKKKAIDDKLKAVRKMEQDLAKLEDNWMEALEAESVSEARKGVLGDIWNKIKEVFGGGQDDQGKKELDTSQQLDLAKNQIAANIAQTSTLEEERAVLIKGAKDNPAYDEQIKLLKDRIAAKEAELVELQAVLDLIILGAKEEDLTQKDLDIKAGLVSDYGSVDEARKEIETEQRERAKKKEAEKPTAWISAADNTSNQAREQMNLDAIYKAITENTTPPTPKSDVSTMPLRASDYEMQIATKKLELADSAKEYTKLLSDLKDWNANAIKQNETSGEDVTTESGTIKIHRITKETLGNL